MTSPVNCFWPSFQRLKRSCKRRTFLVDFDFRAADDFKILNRIRAARAFFDLFTFQLQLVVEVWLVGLYMLKIRNCFLRSNFTLAHSAGFPASTTFFIDDVCNVRACYEQLRHYNYTQELVGLLTPIAIVGVYSSFPTRVRFSFVSIFKF